MNKRTVIVFAAAAAALLAFRARANAASSVTGGAEADPDRIVDTPPAANAPARVTGRGGTGTKPSIIQDARDATNTVAHGVATVFNGAAAALGSIFTGTKR